MSEESMKPHSCIWCAQVYLVSAVDVGVVVEQVLAHTATCPNYPMKYSRDTTSAPVVHREWPSGT